MANGIELYIDMSPQFLQQIAPYGKLRASINLGNPILARRDSVTGEVSGVSIDLSKNLAATLKIDLEILVFDSAGKSVDAVTQDKADFGFFAIDPLRGEGITFTSAYVLIEGAYLVRNESKLTKNEEVDQIGRRIVVGKGSAYDLYLSRELKNAQLVRAPTSPKVVDFFLEGNFEVAAGVKQQLEADQLRLPNLRLLPGRFMVIQQAMGVPKSRSQEVSSYLSLYVEEMKSTGFVAKALQRHRIEGASVAPIIVGL